MKVFKYIQDKDKKEFVEYPRHDMGVIDGLDPNIKYYLTVDDAKPEYDPILQELEYSEEFTGEMHPDYPAIHLVRGRWVVINKKLPLLEDRKNILKEQLKELTLEASTIITTIKNIYDPFDEDKSKIPEEFKTLGKTIQQVRKRVLNDIDNFTTQEEAIKYNIYTQEAEDLLTQLKSFL